MIVKNTTNYLYNVDDQKYNNKWGGLSKDGCLVEMITSLNELSKVYGKEPRQYHMLAKGR